MLCNTGRGGLLVRAAALQSSVVSIGRLTPFYVVLVPMELIPNKPPTYCISICICT